LLLAFVLPINNRQANDSFLKRELPEGGSMDDGAVEKPAFL
jgi:hypothetical protein